MGHLKVTKILRVNRVRKFYQYSINVHILDNLNFHDNSPITAALRQTDRQTDKRTNKWQ